MADPNPLIFPTGSPDPDHSPPSSKHLKTITSLDATIEHCIGDFAWVQLLHAALVSLAWYFDAQQTFISVFTDADPKWICKNSSNTSATHCSDLCRLQTGEWSWELPAESSIISEWSLQCSGALVTGLPASAFFFGCLIGGFALAALADSSLGRKNTLALSSLVMSLSAAAAAISPNVWVYTGLRFVSGFGRATIGTSALVLSTEVVGRRWRESVGVLGFIFFTLGFLSLPALAFSLRGSSWRLLYLWTGVPSILYSAAVYFKVRESPRWLFIKGRRDEFAETLRSMSSPTTRGSLTGSFFGRCAVEKGLAEADDMFSTLRILFGRRWSARRLAAVMVVGFGIGMIYYGMPLGLGNMSFDLYLSVTMNALAEFPASLVTFLLIGKLKRKSLALGLALLSGICSVACVVVGSRLMQVGLELLSFFGACTAFDVVLIYTLELFPTCVRNSALSMVRQALVLGGVLSPMLVAAGRKNGLLLSYGVFGVTIAACGLALLLLPETRGKVLCDTMEEEEEEGVDDDGAHVVY